MSLKTNLIAGAMVAAVATSSAIVPMMAVTDFADYEPPSRLNVTLFDYMDGRAGSGYGSPAIGSRDTDIATWQKEYPHRAFFIGGLAASSHTQNHDVRTYVVFSKKPITDYFDFTYRSSKGTSGTGYIRADFSRAEEDNNIGFTTDNRNDLVIVYYSQTGMPSGTLDVPLYLVNLYEGPAIGNRSYFDFDFYYQCCGDLSVDGLRNITDVPYGYILTCQNPDGSGGGSQSGSSSPGSSSGGDSSGGSSSGGSSSGGSSGGSSSGGSESEWHPKPPFESSGGNPSDEQGSTGDTGEKGDSWTLPSWGKEEDVTGEAGGFQEIKPGTNDWGYEAMQPGTNEWGYEEMKPGTDSWGLQDWRPNVSQGLIDVMQ